MFLATFPQVSAVALTWPDAHEEFHWSTPPEDDKKHPAATPEYSERALICSGYVAAKTLDIMAGYRHDC